MKRFTNDAREWGLPSLLRTVGAAALSVGLATSAGAQTINTSLTPGVLNTIEDQDREAYIDVDRSGTITVGDVFIGFVRIDNFLPQGTDADNHVYAIISNQIIGFNPLDPTQVRLGTTTAAGLTLPELTGDANTAGAMVAIYDSAAPLSEDLILNPPGGATTIQDYFDLIVAESTLRLTAGLGTAGDTYITADVEAGFGVGSPNGIFTTVPTSVTFGSFVGGLDFLYNNTAFTYADAVVTLDPLTGLHTTQLGIARGTFGGMVGEGNEDIWANASTFGFPQCTTGPCGFVTDADFNVVPLQVPEPGSLALIAVALSGFGLVGGIRRRRSRR